jgi:hypothetical protein
VAMFRNGDTAKPCYGMLLWRSPSPIMV